MRIGLISAEYPPQTGGVGDHTARLASELANLGHVVEVITSEGPSTPLDSATRGVRVDRIVRRWNWSSLLTLPRLGIRRSWDVVHIQYQTGAFALHGAINLLPRLIRRQSVAPAVVATFHDLAVPYLFPKAGRLRRLIVQDMVQNCDGVISVADETIGQLYRWTSSAGHPTAVSQIPLGNHFDADPPEGFDRASWREARQIEPTAWVIGHIGFVHESKGITETLAALAMLIAAGHDVHLLMIGQAVSATDEGSRRTLDTILQMISDLGLTTRVHWTARLPVAEVVGWVRCVDVMALPFRDGVSLRRTSLIAALANGVPVVTTDASVPVEWLRGEPPVAVIPGRGPESLAVALETLLLDPLRRAQLMARGLEFAIQFAWPTVAQRTVDLYRQARMVPTR